MTASDTSRRAALGSGLVALAAGSAGAQTAPGGHVVLLGDSVFDNAAYVAGGPDVVAQVRGVLPPGWRATLAAVDGAVTDDVARQLGRVPADATHLVVSAGGNDALRHEAVFGESARGVGEALLRLAAVRERFRRDYETMLDALLGRGLPAAVCTIYDPRFPDPVRQRLAVAGLALFNDAIARAAFARGLSVLDLRLICDAPGDYANPIEPSVQGGAKIARAIAELAATHDAARRRPEVFTGASTGGEATGGGGR